MSKSLEKRRWDNLRGPAHLLRNGEGGCTCHKCLRKYMVDIMVPDEVWDIINPEHASTGMRAYSMLCGPCIMELLEAWNAFGAFKLEVI